MKVKAFSLLCLLFIGLNSFAQDAVFPMRGTFEVERDDNLEKRIFNEVSIDASVFHLMKDGQVLESYRLERTLDRGYHVIQFFQGNVKRDQKRMDVEVVELSENKFQIIIRKGTYEDRLILIRK